MFSVLTDIWHVLTEEKLPRLPNRVLHGAVPYEAGEARWALRIALREKLISREHLRGNIVDFGCGIGGSTLLLHSCNAKVTGIDSRNNDCGAIPAWKLLGGLREFQNAALLPPDTIKIGDGISYLRKLPPDSLDLVTSFMFGPDRQRELGCPFFRDFLNAARSALCESGRILVSSDEQTIAAINELVEPGLLRHQKLWVGTKSNSAWAGSLG